MSKKAETVPNLTETPEPERAPTMGTAAENSASSDAEHLLGATADIPADLLGAEEAAPVNEDAGIFVQLPDGTKAIPREVFRANLAGFIQLPNVMLSPPLASLHVEPEASPARDAFDTLYDICAETPALRWLIAPEGIWTKRLMYLSAWAVPFALGVKAEVDGRRVQAIQAKTNAQAVQHQPEPQPQPAAPSVNTDRREFDGVLGNGA